VGQLERGNRQRLSGFSRLTAVATTILLNFRCIDAFLARSDDHDKGAVAATGHLSQPFSQLWKQPISALLGESVQG
jgi:hypothetical protein